MNKIICWKALIVILLITFTNQADVTVNKLDGISSKNLVYSGFLPISNSSSDQLFFTFYGKQNVQQQSDLKNYPLVIVVGSPGSSAQFINFAGFGPITLKSDMTTVENTESPSIFANVMFVDLLGNGFSFVADTASFPTKSEDYGAQLTYAINAFAKQSVLGKSSVVVIAGEGTFIRSLPGLDDIDTLSGIIHIASWPELYAVSKYYGVAGVELKLFGTSQKVAIESTLISCSNYVTNKKYLEAHNCYESVLNFVQSKTKNANLFNIRLGSNFTDHFATIQYYLSQSSTVSSLKAPTSKIFDTQSNLVWSKTFVDIAINKTASLSQFMKDYLTVKHWFVIGSNDFISYKQSIRLWLENELSFVESAAFRTAKLDDIMIEGSSVGYGKQVKQVKYSELFDAGHYIVNDQTKVFSYLLNNWLSGLNDPVQKNLFEEQSEVLIAQE